MSAWRQTSWFGTILCCLAAEAVAKEADKRELGTIRFAAAAFDIVGWDCLRVVFPHASTEVDMNFQTNPVSTQTVRR